MVDDKLRANVIDAIWGDGIVETIPTQTPVRKTTNYVEENNDNINKFKDELLVLMKKHNISLTNPNVGESTALFMQNLKRSL